MSSVEVEPRVILYIRSDCHLCDEALLTVERVCGPAGVDWASINVDGDPVLEAEYGHYVPALLVDGVQQGFWQIDANRLARLVNEPAG